MLQLLAAVLLTAFFASGSGAATLASATLDFFIYVLPPANFTAVGASGAATSDTTATLGGGSAFAGSFSETLTRPQPVTKLTVDITQNEPGHFSGATANQVGGLARFGGVASVWALGSKLLEVPLSLGVPSTVFQGRLSTSPAITVISAAWTVGVVSVTDTGLGTARRTGHNGLDERGVGVLQLVTPVRILSEFHDVTAAFGVLTLTYVPEPGSLLLLGLGIAGLAALGRQRS